MKNLGLFGTNKSRQNTILWDVIEQLRKEHYILEAQELPGRGTGVKIQFKLNPEKMSNRGKK